MEGRSTYRAPAFSHTPLSAHAQDDVAGVVAAAAAMLFGDEVFVRVRDRRGGDDFVLNPRKHVALSAFHHPYALRPLDTSKYATPAARAQREVT
jgi:hypothetical protein